MHNMRNMRSRRRHALWNLLLVGPIVSGLLATLTPVGPSDAAAFRPLIQQGHVNYREATVRPSTLCESLRGRVLDSEATIERAHHIAASDGVPAHCDVVVSVKATLHVGIDLPMMWNQRNYVLGNGGFGGGSVESAAAIAERDSVLVNNFTVASNDDGVPNPPSTYGIWLRDPATLADYSYRAVHLSAVYVKEVADLFYGQNAALTYFFGCSDGGREGLIAAQRFPADYNGIVAGAAVLADTDLQLQNTWNAEVAYPSAPFSPAQTNTIATAVLAKCGETLNGTPDGIVADPRLCKFNPDKDIPKCTGSGSGSGSANCLTQAQIDAYKSMIYGPVSKGQQYFPGMPVGSEGNWVNAVVPSSPGATTYQALLGEAWVQYALGYRTGRQFNPATFNFNTDPYVDNNLAPIHQIADATDTNLAPFEHLGGKMISYVGWADPLVGPWSLVGYYESVANRMGLQDELKFYRFFTDPGVAHCGGGAGPDTIDPFSLLVDWVEQGLAPDTMIASKLSSSGSVLFQRTLCRYPYMGQFINGDNPLLASSWRCVEGPTGVPLQGYPLRDPFDSRYHEISP
jgi:feruloyl esterase